MLCILSELCALMLYYLMCLHVCSRSLLNKLSVDFSETSSLAIAIDKILINIHIWL